MVLSWPVEPMVARPAQAIPEGEMWSYEPKFDGFRCLVMRPAGGPVALRSRRQRSLTTAFSEVAEIVAERLPADTIVDGELVVMDGGRVSFESLQRRLATRRIDPGRSATIIVFDLLAHAGEDIRALPYTERRARLSGLIGASGTGLALMPATSSLDAAGAWMSQGERGVEGVVAKRVDHAYAPPRRHWWKIRTRNTIEAVIGGVTGSRAVPTGLILGQYDQLGQLRVIGRTTRLGAKASREIARKLREPVGPHPWPTELPGGRFGLPGAEPVEHLPVAPELVVEVEADTAFELGRYRHGLRFVRLRHDLSAEEIAQS
jgi:ATP-dependent DNA ligase